MTNPAEIIQTRQLQFTIYIGISLAVTVFAGVLFIRSDRIFHPYFGRINPVIAVMLTALTGLILFIFLISRGWFAIYQMGNQSGLLVAAGLAGLLGLAMILFDSRFPFPANINVPYPESLLFYPTVGFVVDILFHVLPVTLLLFGLTSLFTNMQFQSAIWLTLVSVSLLEPIYQTVLALPRGYPGWFLLVVGVYIFLINICQLLIFKRYDFVSMYAFRLVYYLVWHIVWGHIRLKLLF
jgi:hypothetical protein